MFPGDCGGVKGVRQPRPAHKTRACPAWAKRLGDPAARLSWRRSRSAKFQVSETVRVWGVVALSPAALLSHADLSFRRGAGTGSPVSHPRLHDPNLSPGLASELAYAALARTGRDVSPLCELPSESAFVFQSVDQVVRVCGPSRLLQHRRQVLLARRLGDVALPPAGPLWVTPEGSVSVWPLARPGSAGNWADLGVLLARLHARSDWPRRAAFSVYDGLEQRICELQGGRYAPVASDAQRLLVRLEHPVSRAVREGRVGWAHGDANVSNMVLWQGSARLIDLERTGRGVASADLARPWAMPSPKELEAADFEQLSRGYVEQLQLPSADVGPLQGRTAVLAAAVIVRSALAWALKAHRGRPPAPQLDLYMRAMGRLLSSGSQRAWEREAPSAFAQ